MATSAEQILSEALVLPAAARAFVAEKLIESLDGEPGAAITPAWQEEIARRAREVEAGAVELRSAADVLARARDSLA
jgi:hypothetical protein